MNLLKTTRGASLWLIACLGLLGLSSSARAVTVYPTPTYSPAPTPTPSPTPDPEDCVDYDEPDPPCPVYAVTTCGTLPKLPTTASANGTRLANIAKQKPVKDPNKVYKRCYRGVKDSIRQAGLSGGSSLSGGQAHDFPSEVPSGFREVCNSGDPKNDPAGTIHVYDRPGEAGHIDISTGDGRLSSDCIRSNNPSCQVYTLTHTYYPF